MRSIILSLSKRIGSLSHGRNSSSSFLAILTNWRFSRFLRNICSSSVYSSFLASHFLVFSTISTTLESCHFPPSIMMRSGIIPEKRISSSLRIMISRIESKSLISHSCRVLIRNFLYLVFSGFPLTRTLREATVCVPER